MKHKIESILIVGGGSSGWMTAAAIAKQLPNIKLTLIESPTVATIGVGESTIGQINEYLACIGLTDKDWMKHCNATYKTSIKFIDFKENPSNKEQVFHYPFGIFDFTDKPRKLMEWFNYKARHPDIDTRNFAEFFHDSVLMTDKNKLTFNLDHKIRGFDFNFDTAYHMDASLFGNYLKETICLPSGMTYLQGDVIGAEKDKDGSIKSLRTKDHGVLTADLYIDCTGFRSLLLEQQMNVPFESFHDTLLNDSAVATVIPYIDKEKEMECVTSCTAIESGWVWNIPLWNRIGTGYVYSSKFASEQEAEEQFRKHLKSNKMICPDVARADAAEFKHIKIKHGVHKRAWEKNVVGIGLSNGFIEPLESTGLMLTHEAIMKLITALLNRNGHVTKFDIDQFNFALYEQVTGFKQFISLHYALSMRNDTPYWRCVSEGITYSPDMVNFVSSPVNSYSDVAYRNYRSRIYDASNMGGIIYILAGMGHSPVNKFTVEYLDKRYREIPNYWEESYATWKQHRDQVLEVIDQLPSHYEFLRQNIYS